MACRDCSNFVTRQPSVELVSSQPLSFSISKILDLDDDRRPSSSRSASRSSPTISNRNPSSHRQCFGTCRTGSLSYYEDRRSGSEGDYENDDHRQKIINEKSSRKKRQRTTFSPIEVEELERVFKRRPFLTPEDEDGLVQRLGITPKSVKYWFQNRRAKLRKDALKMVYQEEPSNSFNHFTRLASSKVRRVTFPQHYSDHIWRPEFSENELQHQPPAMTPALSHYSSIKSNQFKVHPAFCVPMFPAYQCRTTSVDQEEVKFASKIRRYQPY